MKYHIHPRTLILGLVLVFPGYLSAQPGKDADLYLRNNPAFKNLFHDVVAPAAVSTVRVLCDGKETSLGMVVGADGWILTKANDLKGKITCRFKDGKFLGARRMGINVKHDLAMLKIEATGLEPVKFVDSKGTPPGNWVACADPNGQAVAIGVISVATRNVPEDNRPKPLANGGYLGVALESSPDGLRIAQVMPKSAAQKSGLYAGDIVLSLSGKAVSGPEDFIKEMHKFKVGDTVTLKIRRAKEEKEIRAQLGKRPPNRGEIQNKMGSELSSRRSGYPTIFQFDGVIKPSDCGGPVVNLDGQVIGICICRAGRTENWAIPSEVIIPLLAGLKQVKEVPVAKEKKTEDGDLQAAREKARQATEDAARAKKAFEDLRKEVIRTQQENIKLKELLKTKDELIRKLEEDLARARDALEKAREKKKNPPAKDKTGTIIPSRIEIPPSPAINPPDANALRSPDVLESRRAQQRPGSRLP